MEKTVLHIKHMLCSSCIHLVRLQLKTLNIEMVKAEIGRVEIRYNETQTPFSTIEKKLSEVGLELSKSEEEILVDRIKQKVIDLVFHMNNIDSIVQKSDYLVEMLNMSYDKIARVFRKHEPITLEKYSILVKVERIKEMLGNESYTLSEIAYLMDYSSVQYLSTQFKKNTGITVSEYKNQDKVKRIPLDKVIAEYVNQ